MNIPNPTLRSVERTKWIWLMAIVLGILQYLSPINSEMQLVTHKLFVGTLALIVSHIGTKSLYDYISLYTLFDRDKFNEIPDSIKFIGACILRGMLESAFVLGVMLGI